MIIMEKNCQVICPGVLACCHWLTSTSFREKYPKMLYHPLVAFHYKMMNFYICMLILFTDALDVWDRVHPGCWDEAGCPAGGWEGEICCRKGTCPCIILVNIFVFQYVIICGECSSLRHNLSVERAQVRTLFCHVKPLTSLFCYWA